MRMLFFILCFLSFNVNAQVSQRLATDVLTVLKNLGVPNERDGEFNYWVYAVSLMTARQCWSSANGTNFPMELSFLPSIKVNYSEIQDGQLPYVCQSIAEKGISPFCFSSELKSEATKKIFILSSEYLQIRRMEDISLVKTSLNCTLNDEMLNVQVFETRNAILRWVKNPELKPVKSKNGVYFFKVAILKVDVPLVWDRNRKPYAEEKEIVLQN